MVSSELWFGAEASFYNGVATQSLRFNDSDNAFLSKTFGSGSQRTWTWSGWVKRSVLGAAYLYSQLSSGADVSWLYFNASDQLNMQNYEGGNQVDIKTNAKFRDVSSWYHVMAVLDTTQSTNTDRAKMYVNGELQTSLASSTYPSQNADLKIGSGDAPFIIGATPDSYGTGEGYKFDGYFAEVNFVDGIALDPTYFGETKNGVWIPKKYTGSYGTNGFRLQFAQVGVGTASSSTIGADTSGNNNHYTSSGIVASDCNMPDSPENNFATLNPLTAPAGGLEYLEGNLKITRGTVDAYSFAMSTLAVQTGKWYAELRPQGTITANNHMVGVCITNVKDQSSGDPYLENGQINYVAVGNGHVDDGGSINASTFSGSTSFGAGDIIGVALDLDSGTRTVKFYKNGSLVNTSSYGNLSSEFDNAHIGFMSILFGANTCMWNFGQDSTFAGQISAGGNTDGNGIGDFKYAPPSGYLALCSSNLSEPTISPNANTQADDHFNTVTYTGVEGTQSITGVGFQPDWLWIKVRNEANSHYIFDSSRGADQAVFADLDSAEVDYSSSGRMSAFGTDGFTVKTSGSTGTNGNDDTYVAWNWKAGGTTPTKTYKVVVVSDSGNKYRFRNSADSATFAQSAVTLDLQELGTYTFDLSDSSVDGHPMKFSTTSNGSHGGGSTYSTGVVYKLDGVTKTESEYVSGFNSATTRQIIITVASSAPVLYYFCHYHSAMGGQINTNTTHGSTNFDGNILSVSNANTTSGFSIITYTGGGSAGDTIGHGLNSAPEQVWFKRRDSSGNWMNYIKAMGNNGYMNLDRGNAKDTGGSPVNNTDPSSTVITLGSFQSLNGNTNTYVAYAFAPVEGYSKFGSYTGNGSSDGVFIYLGFRPAFIITKQTNATGNWIIMDSVRSSTNVGGHWLYADGSFTEDTGSSRYYDFVSNGFKLRNGGTGQNDSGDTYIYIAFAEQPFRYANAR